MMVAGPSQFASCESPSTRNTPLSARSRNASTADGQVDVDGSHLLVADVVNDLAEIGGGFMLGALAAVDKQLPAVRVNAALDGWAVHQLIPLPRSAPMNRRPRVRAAYPNEPDPANGSTISSPGSVSCWM